MNYTKSFSQVSKEDVITVGGKGASLGELLHAGMPVPPGFVVLSSAYDRFKDEGKMPSDIAEEIKKGFTELNTQRVAVRSSATAEDSRSASWAGQLDSYLNTTEDTLLENVQKCWESLESARSKFYRSEQGLADAKISVAVVIQEMIESEVAGTAFSVHPVTEDANQVIIEAGLGLGEAVVGGTITPDMYVVAKDRRSIVEKKLHAQGTFTEQKVSDEHILKLAELVIAIEKHYGFPVDVEWAFANEKFYIVQSRPITTLSGVRKGGEVIHAKTQEGIPNLLKNRHFHKQFVYSFLPVIAFESANYCYVENPLIEKLGIKKLPAFVVIWKDNYEDWGDDSIQKIRDEKTIRFLIEENKAIVKKHEKRANELLTLPYKDMANEELADSLKEIDAILTEVYHRYIFLIHDYFETDSEELISILPEVRIEMSEFVDKFYQCCDRIIEALANMFTNVPWQTFMYATFDEILHLLKNPETVQAFEKIYERKLAFVFDGKKLEIIKDQKEIKNIVDFLRGQEEVEDTDVTEIRGTVAFKGVARGKVFKISEYEYGNVGNVTKDRDNYILVTPMTRPEFLPFLKKAKAIVTDEGGLTCHAAIVARELQIPCIVGTKIATRILDNGDLVEVDAEQGVIRIIPDGTH